METIGKIVERFLFFSFTRPGRKTLWTWKHKGDMKRVVQKKKKKKKKRKEKKEKK